MPGIIEETDRAWLHRLQVPRVGIDDARLGAKAGVAYPHNLEAQTLEGLLKERDVVVRIGELSDLAAVGFIADQERDALFRERARVEENEEQKAKR